MSKTEQNRIPKNYEELYTLYVQGERSLTNQILRTMLPYETPDTREDLAMEVFTRAMDKHLLEIFDPAKSNFGGAIYFTTRSVATAYLSRKSHSPIGNLQAGSLTEQETEDFEPGSYDLNRMFAVEPPKPETLDAKSKVAKLYEAVTAQPQNNKRGQSLRQLLDLMLEGFTPEESAQKLGVTQSTISNWTRYLATLVQ